MSLRLPIGTSNFKEIIEKNLYFVDKSLWIKEVIDSTDKVLLITRPRRFGKTLNMSMLEYFLSDSPAKKIPNLYKNTEITKYKTLCSEHQNKYPLIFISFKDAKQDNFEDLLSTIRLVISSVYDQYNYLLNSDRLSDNDKKNIGSIIDKTADKASLTESIKALSRYLEKNTGKKAYILIDEYDTPITAGYMNGFYKEAIGIMRSIFGFALKDNSYLEKSVVTGITKISQESLFSGVNNLEHYGMLDDEHGQYFGFTETETKNLLKIDENSSQFDKIKHWYNGYQIGKHTIYNPWSILKCVKKKYKYHPYWINTADNSLIQELISTGKYDIKEKFIDLLQGKSIQAPLIENLVFPDLKTDEESLWSLLHATGYIKAINEIDSYNENIDLAIPNKEISYVYKNMVKRWFTKTVSIESYKRFINSLSEGQIDIFHAELSNFLQESGSYFDFNQNSSEHVFHTFMLGIVIGLKENYLILSNRESGYGRYDLILIPKLPNKHGIILEFKTSKKEKNLKARAREGLNQIKDKKYYTTFKQNKTDSVLMLGLAFCNKKVEIASEVHKL